MKPTKTGQVAKFHTPLADEDPNQLYVVLEINQDENDEKSGRALIKPLNIGLTFPPINTVKLDDLIVVKLPTNELIGHKVTILKSDHKQVIGKVISVKDNEIQLDLIKSVKGVKTNVQLTIIDNKGIEHEGNLFVF
jgi:hypothetical protein